MVTILQTTIEQTDLINPYIPQGDTMTSPSLSYNILKFSLQIHHSQPQTLDPKTYAAIISRAKEECLLQKKIMNSKEGGMVVIPEESVEEAVSVIARRYDSPEAFAQDLAANDLDLNSLAAALGTDLAVDAAVTQVALRADPPSEEEVDAIFKARNKKRPEQRNLRHILITINEQFPENRRETALSRITVIREKALTNGADFSELAQHYSECPSALQGGILPPMTQDKIDLKLGETLFSMEEGEISEVVESTMGFHILLCEKVLSAEIPAPNKTKALIRKHLLAQNSKKEVQKWIASL